MSNKFQLALDSLYKNIKIYTGFDQSKQDKENLATLQELVDKETAKNLYMTLMQEVNNINIYVLTKIVEGIYLKPIVKQ